MQDGVFIIDGVARALNHPSNCAEPRLGRAVRDLTCGSLGAQPRGSFPLFDAAGGLGIRHIAVHTSLALRPAPGLDAFRPGDVEHAAGTGTRS